MFTIWYLANSGRLAEEKMEEYINRERSSPHHWTDSAMGSMGLMVVMALEFEICVVVDFCLLALIMIL